MNIFKNTKFHQKLYIMAVILSYVAYFITFTGIIYINPLYISYLNTFVTYYVSLFLMWRFNIFSNNNTIDKFDKNVVFAAGFLLFLSTSAFSIIKNYIFYNLFNYHII